MIVLRWLLAATSALGLGAQETTVLLLHHAERQSLLDDDAPLSTAGQHRALALAPLLKGFQPAALFTYDRLWVLRIPAKGEPSLEDRQQGF